MVRTRSLQVISAIYRTFNTSQFRLFCPLCDVFKKFHLYHVYGAGLTVFHSVIFQKKFKTNPNNKIKLIFNSSSKIASPMYFFVTFTAYRDSTASQNPSYCSKVLVNTA